MSHKLRGVEELRKKHLPAFHIRNTLARMSYVYLFALAIIQGVTEFLPVSSSGHLALAHSVTAFPDQGVLVDVALHGGTLLAVIAYFRHDVALILRGLIHLVLRRESFEARMAGNLIIATLPVLVAGGALVLSGYADTLRSPTVIAWASIGFALPLYLADRLSQRLDFSSTTWSTALFIGLAQICALIPGASRSGVTMTAGRFCGFNRHDAAKFSMLMAMPVIGLFALAGLLDLYQSQDHGRLSVALIGAAVAAIFAFATIHGFLKLTARVSYTPFVLYRLALGIVILMTLA